MFVFVWSSQSISISSTHERVINIIPPQSLPQHKHNDTHARAHTTAPYPGTIYTRFKRLSLNFCPILAMHYALQRAAYGVRVLFVRLRLTLPVSLSSLFLCFRGRPRGIVPVYRAGVVWAIWISKWRPGSVSGDSAAAAPYHTRATPTGHQCLRFIL